MEILSYYLPAIREVVSLLKELEKDPMGNKATCLAIQERLIVNLTNIEARIQKTKKEVSAIKQRLGDRNLKNTKEEAKQLKARSKSLLQRVDEYQYLRILFKSIGDGIAFLYINRFDLKTQNFKQSTGFISNKKGNRLERQCFRQAFKAGGIAIMNDLTNVLKYFDLMIIAGIDAWYPIEVKSGSSKNKVQADKGSTLMKYLIADVPADIYERGGPMIRQSLTSSIQDHVGQVNALIGDARQKGFALRQLEEGLTILATFRDNVDDFDGLMKSLKLVDPILFCQNNYAVTQFGYYPYCLSIKATDDYLDFLSGKLQLFHFFDCTSLQPIADKHDYNYEFLGEEQSYVKFIRKDDPEFGFAVSWHSFSRIFFEYISSSWLINDHFLQMEEMIRALKENPDLYKDLH